MGWAIGDADRSLHQVADHRRAGALMDEPRTAAGLRHCPGDRALRPGKRPRRHHHRIQRPRRDLPERRLQRPGRLRVPGPRTRTAGPVRGRGPARSVHPRHLHLHPTGPDQHRGCRAELADPADPRLLPDPGPRGPTVLRRPRHPRCPRGGHGHQRQPSLPSGDAVHRGQHDRGGQQHPRRRRIGPAGRHAHTSWIGGRPGHRRGRHGDPCSGCTCCTATDEPRQRLDGRH